MASALTHAFFAAALGGTYARARAGAFFGEWGLAVILSELLWVWLPAGLCLAAVLISRRRARPGASR